MCQVKTPCYILWFKGIPWCDGLWTIGWQEGLFCSAINIIRRYVYSIQILANLYIQQCDCPELLASGLIALTLRDKDLRLPLNEPRPCSDILKRYVTNWRFAGVNDHFLFAKGRGDL